MTPKIIPQDAIDRARRGVLVGRQYPREFPNWLIYDTLHPDERYCVVPDDGVLSALTSIDGTPFELAARLIRDADTGNVWVVPQRGYMLPRQPMTPAEIDAENLSDDELQAAAGFLDNYAANYAEAEKRGGVLKSRCANCGQANLHTSDTTCAACRWMNGQP